MRIFLGIIGILAMLGGGFSFFLAVSAVQEIVGGIALLIGCTSLGLARVIELLEAAAKKRDAWEKTSREHFSAQPAAAAMEEIKKIPPLPGKERYYLAVGETIGGPHSREVIEGMLNRGTVSQHATFVLLEGGTKWQKFNEAFEVTS